ncbi:hypothetical protein HK097_004178, partial [Rhizophlyctis rosea]
MSYFGPYLFFDQIPNATWPILDAPYTATQQSLALSLAILQIIGLVTNIGLVIVFLSDHRHLRSSNSWMVFALCLADFTNLLFNVFPFAINAAAGSFASGHVGCMRYVCVVRGQQLSRNHLITSLGSIWAISFVTAISPFWFKDSQYKLRPSGVLCLADWTDPTTHGKSFTAWTLIALSTAIAIIIVCYVRVFAEIRRSGKALSFSSGRGDVNMRRSISLETRPQSGGKREKSAREVEAKVAMRSVVIVTVFLIEWAPLGAVFVLEFFTGRAVSPLFDYISKFCANTNFVCNSLLFMFLDRRFSERTKELFSLHR